MVQSDLFRVLTILKDKYVEDSLEARLLVTDCLGLKLVVVLLSLPLSSCQWPTCGGYTM